MYYRKRPPAARPPVEKTETAPVEAPKMSWITLRKCVEISERAAFDWQGLAGKAAQRHVEETTVTPAKKFTPDLNTALKRGLAVTAPLLAAPLAPSPAAPAPSAAAPAAAQLHLDQMALAARVRLGIASR